MEILISFLTLGIASGILAGLLGVGGGLVVVPALAVLFTLEGFDASIIMHMAIGTSLATIVSTAISSIYAHQRYENIQWKIVWLLSPGLIMGALLGTLLAKQMDSSLLKIIFASFVILVAIQMAFKLLPASKKLFPAKAILHMAGIVIGSLSSLVGIGGGSLSVPFLVWCNVSMKKAIATSAACGLPIALAGAVGFVLTGWQAPLLPSYSSGYLYWPAALAISITSVLFAPLGAKLTQHFPVLLLKRLFALFLLLVGIKMLFG